MIAPSPFRKRGRWAVQSGIGVLETAVALGIMGIVVVVLLTGLAAAQKYTSAAERRATAQSLAEIQMEYVKKAPYLSGATSYELRAAPATSDYERYSGSAYVVPVADAGAGIQKVTIRIVRDGEELASLEGYKVDR
ncbi:MAG: hypothetical protein HYY29_02165 [Chloroflexi bacterium]|nr:hypothetical protein [Chloroflexota bacterium]